MASGNFVSGARRVVVRQDGALILRPELDIATCRKSA
jgi:hypothetical protein